METRFTSMMVPQKISMMECSDEFMCPIVQEVLKFVKDLAKEVRKLPEEKQ